MAYLSRSAASITLNGTPKDLEVWFGSHQSGAYGYLGYDLLWDEVEAGTIPQTLYIPAGCHLTLVNMEI